MIVISYPRTRAVHRAMRRKILNIKLRDRMPCKETTKRIRAADIIEVALIKKIEMARTQNKN